ncbi:hypothetical protein N8H41_08870 [Pseudomonas vlassakiae]|uniref:hypothetical protein n=1 Tax=Pseudomonas TaxID=286 RepID=UPI0006D489B7|nr:MULTISPECIES: hypothetical protein [Pseudomonas]MCU0124088.1 hypothetical protein [Pseudomonas vlassakiae]
MALLELKCQELTRQLERLGSVIDLNKDLPANLFIDGEYVFWFFERPLLSYLDIFLGIVNESIISFKSDVHIKFSGGENLAGSCFSITGGEVREDVAAVMRKFDDFNGGKIGYPIIFFNDGFEWIAFESAYEEFGVMAVKASALKGEYVKYLDSSLISGKEMIDLAAGCLPESVAAKALVMAYHVN